CYLSCYCHVYHPYLRSFPTRRSSDLASTSSVSLGGIVPLTLWWATISADSFDWDNLTASLTCPPNILPKHFSISVKYRSCSSCRSEEHTSELQSRENLVCRLLLEKKK